MFERNHGYVLAMLASFSFLSFTACSDDVVNNPMPMATESSAVESSSAESSSSETFSNPISSSDVASSSSEISSASRIVNLTQLSKCDAHNEGAVDSIWNGNAKYGFTINYYKCEKGNWYEAEPVAACDTAGVSVGSLCNVHISEGGFYCCGDRWGKCYEYVGNGIWNESECLKAPAKECNAENEWDTGKITYSNGYTAYYQCLRNVWKLVDEVVYNCTTSKTVEGDTCSFESQGEKLYYLFEDGYWYESNFDPKLGACPIREDAYYRQRFKESDGAFYYCDEGKWKPTKLIPQQYTDSRKKGLTDEEYDVLDLPKEASVNDRVAGLLEDCWDKDVLLAQKLEHNDDIGFQYSYCLPQNYYRYREDGTWTLETTDEGIADELLHSIVCSKSEDPQSVRDTIPASRYRLSRVVGCKDNSIVRISFIYPEKKAQ
ncbi:hypothetical protein [Fibrobacter sp.]|uniref:hypothetical protein n=1 Tax=Fibrobacter sp. TaxID=35828 RepID=UPI003869F277